MLSPAGSIPRETPFSGIDFSGGAIVAVSGGSDSTALLLLTKQHLTRTFPAARLVAVTVDHGLRPESATEARIVGDLCRRHEISHRILCWGDPKPKTGLPAAARAARYRLLSQAAQEEGIGMVLTGHTADDQAETVLMRRARAATSSEDARGLAGMAPATLYDGCIWIVRPLLGTRRTTLRDWLETQGTGWCEDPSNDNATFERPRVRAALGVSGEATIQGALSLGNRAAADRVDLGQRAAALIRAHAARSAAGLLRLDHAFLAQSDTPAVIYALRILLAAAGGAHLLPDLSRATALLKKLEQWQRQEVVRATLSHAVVERRAAGLFVYRERRGLPGAAPAEDRSIWDGRYRINLRNRNGAILIGAAGQEKASTLAPQAADLPQSLLRAASAAEPAFFAAEPGGDSEPARTANPLPGTASPVVAPFALFLSCFDLAPAHAMAELVGADAIPAPPSCGTGDPCAYPGLNPTAPMRLARGNALPMLGPTSSHGAPEGAPQRDAK